ncbi:hypothetical protein [Streptomyces sp. NPDC058304]|uniref:hypothetical protein n=1 Tax=Streptomyces sp. NPDC058304 TaxID=3346437 RepID=UPI0036E64FB2
MPGLLAAVLGSVDLGRAARNGRLNAPQLLPFGSPRFSLVAALQLMLYSLASKAEATGQTDAVLLSSYDAATATGSPLCSSQAACACGAAGPLQGTVPRSYGKRPNWPAPPWEGPHHPRAPHLHRGTRAEHRTMSCTHTPRTPHER